MDVLRKELNSIYASQNLGAEQLDNTILQDCIRRITDSVSVTDGCMIITDASADKCYISGGTLTRLIGINEAGTSTYFITANTSDEDDIYQRMHPVDLVEKRMLEYEFFKFIDSLPPDDKTHHKATCIIRLKDCQGKYISIFNSTRIMRTSPAGKIWLILCTYSLPSSQEPINGIQPKIIDERTGIYTDICLSGKRKHILTEREKQILSLIREGYASKNIACELDISIHTVNRHRQNILEKLSVGNSLEAVKAAMDMKLL